MAEYISKTDVVNMAYVMLGDFEIDDIDDNTDSLAKRANKWYEANVRAIIRKFSNFNRCEQYFKLTNDGVPPIVSRYSYKVNIPPNVISIQEVTEADGTFIKPWKVSGQHIYSNHATIYIRTQAYIDDPNLWDAMMLSAVATRLAWILCMPTTGDKARKALLKADFEEMFEDAVMLDSQEGSPDEVTGQDEELTQLMGIE